MPEKIRNYLCRFRGGVDTETPDLEVQPGRLIESFNYEVGADGGYRDIDGYEQVGTLDGGRSAVQGLFALDEKVYAVKGGKLFVLDGDDWKKATLTATWILFFDGAKSGIEAGATLESAAEATATFRIEFIHYNTEDSGYLAATELKKIGSFTNDSAVNDSDGVKQFDLAGTPREVSLPSTGRLGWDQGNFGGTDYVFLAFGNGRAMRFDGSKLVPVVLDYINPGRIAPQHVVVNAGRLILSAGSSFFMSGVGKPLSFASADGASEVQVGDDITGMRTEPGHQGGSYASIFSRNRIHILGTDVNGAVSLHPYRTEIGAIPFSDQTMGESVFADEWGVRLLSVSERFGNFAHVTLTRQAQSKWNEAVKGRSVAGSLICRAKNQYRIYFDDGSGFHITIRGRRTLGVMPVELPERPSCFLSHEFSGVGERMFMGTADGQVMELDKGMSFNEREIACGLLTRLDYVRSAGVMKQAFDVQLSGSAEGRFELNVMLLPDFQNFDGLWPLKHRVEMLESGEIVKTGLSSRGRADSPVEAFRVGLTVPVNIEVLDSYGENFSLAIGRRSAESHPVTWSGFRIRHTLPEQQVNRHFRARENLAADIVPRWVAAPGLSVDSIPRPPGQPPRPDLEVLGARSIRVAVAVPRNFDWGSGEAGTFIVHYAIKRSQVFLTVESGRNSIVLEGLTPGEEYEVRVSARNNDEPPRIGPQSEPAFDTTESASERGYGVAA